jgi:flagellum-specific peptidoglycan hydrolase FlgJ
MGQERATEAARAGYATDPSYESVLRGVMRKIESVGGQLDAA